MTVLIDGDGCPVVDITVALCRKASVSCIIFTDTAHEICREGAETVVLDKGADSVDFAVANRTKAGDIVFTQDYGVASMCLAKGTRVLHQDGWEYTGENIDALLLSRHESRKFRASGGRTKGPKKRSREQDSAFACALERLLYTVSQG